jgi:hypothetical protein
MEEEKPFLYYSLLHSDKKESSWSKFIDFIRWRIIHRLEDFYREVKYAIQRYYRHHHCSDADIWNLNYHLAEIILKKLKAFKSAKRVAYPTIYCEYEEDSAWASKEEYDKQVASGNILGGGEKAWEAALDEMIFAFEFYSNYESGIEKSEKRVLKKYGLKDPHARIPENRHVSYAHEMASGHRFNSHRKDDEKSVKFLGEEVSYYNFDLEKEYWERAQKGFELFGKHFMSLWD